MEKKHKDTLLEKRVELVETLDMTGGLYTQLLAKRVLNQRKVNEIKLQRSPEAQAEALLDYLPKKECFDAFCDALKADDQEHIVEKYLKPLVTAASIPPPSSIPECSQGATTPVAPPSNPAQQQGNPASNEPVSTEDTDSANGLKRPLGPSPLQAVVCIKEADEKYLYIQYTNPASPAKRQKAMIKPSENNIMVEYETDETRYAMKHFLAEKLNVDNNNSAFVCHPSNISNISNQAVVFQNPQSLQNPNISDQARYDTAFKRQQAEKPFENSSSSTPFTRLRLDPSISTSFLSSSNDLEQQISTPLDNRTQSQSQNSHFIPLGNRIGSLSAPNSSSKLFSSNSGECLHVDDPVKLLQQSGILNSSKVPTSAVAPPQYSLSANLSQAAALMADSVDCAGVPIPASSIKPLKMIPHIPDNSELEIDLPDGCVKVQVEHSSKQFFLNNFKKSYPMRRIPRGLALVMNVDEVKGKSPRKGTNFDRDNLCNLLSQLHFNCLVYNDSDGLSAQEMVNKLKSFAKLKEHYNYDACFICLLSHGEEGYIFGTDGKRIPLEEIFMLFGNTSCKGLIGKPKVFIIQACRGGTLDKGVRMDEPDGSTLPALPQLPSLSDMLICYPTQMGYYAWRNRARGSWYIEAIVQVFMRYAKCEDICAMLNRVNLDVSKKVSECNLKEMNQMSQMSEYKSTLRQPHLFLFPGIGCSNQ